MKTLYLMLTVILLIFIIVYTSDNNNIKDNFSDLRPEEELYNQCIVDPPVHEVNDHSFSVLCGGEDLMAESADVFNEIHDNLEKLINHLNIKKETEGPNMDPRLLTMINNINRRYGGASTFGEITAKCQSRDAYGNCTDPDTAYTIDKGELIAICLRKSHKGEVHDMNTLMFVVIHELTHIAIDVFDHPPEFWESFKILLTEAVRCCVYRPVNYDMINVKYCGEKMIIEYNPLFDKSLEVEEHTKLRDENDIYKLNCCPY